MARGASAWSRVGALTVAGLWSSGTTYVLFALYARDAEPPTLGRYVAVTSLVLLATQLLDGGAGLLMVRDVARAPDERSRRTLMRTTLRRRCRALVPAVIIVASLTRLVFDLAGVGVLALVALYLVAATLYGFVIQVLQAGRDFRRLIALQSANGACFLIGGALVVSSADELSVALMLAPPAFSFALLAAVGLGLVSDRLVGRTGTATPGGSELLAVRGGSTAVALTGNVDQLLLGAVSASTLAAYAGAQRAAIGLAALSTALTNYLLPNVSAADVTQHRRLLRRARVLAAPVVLGGLLVGALLSWPLQSLYEDPRLAQPLVLALLTGAYALGALSTLPVAVLYARGRGAAVAASSSLQAVLVLAGCAAAAAAESAVGTAAVVLFGRSVYLAFVYRAANSHSPGSMERT